MILVDSARIVEEVSIEDQSEKTKKKKKSKHVLEVQENNTKEHQMAEGLFLTYVYNLFIKHRSYSFLSIF